MKRVRSGLVVCALMLSGCGGGSETAPHFEMVGESSDLQRVAGTWRGTFENFQLGRSGQIEFRLSATPDSVFGEVVMQADASSPPPGSKPGELPSVPSGTSFPVRRFRFMRVAGSDVSGEMEPVYEPRCDCYATPTFTGQVHGSTMQGSYTSRSEDGKFQTTGSWKVERVESK